MLSVPIDDHSLPHRFAHRGAQATLFILFSGCGNRLRASQTAGLRAVNAIPRNGATPPMLTFHGSQELKDQRIAQVRAHRLADQLVHGQYWQDGKGCAVGCTIHSGEHMAYETELGIPVELAYAEDNIFERLGNGKAMLWPERFLQAIPVGVDLRATHVNKRYVLALLTDETRGIIHLTNNDAVRQRATEVAEFLKQGISEPSPTMAPDALRRMADLADLADLAYLADLAEMLLEVLAASASPTSSKPTKVAALKGAGKQ
jgi:hypothetical protein